MNKEDKLLILCAGTRINNDIESEIRSIIKQGVNWEYLIHKSEINGLKPLLLWQINRICSKYLPQDILNEINDYFIMNSQKNLLMFGELVKILKILKSSNIPVTPYKGPVLAISAYNNLSLRMFSDLDIIIRKKDINKVEELLDSIGYEPLMKLNKNQKKLFLKYQREIKFVNRLGVHVEVKWRFPVATFSFPIDPICLLEIKEFFYNNIKLNTIIPEKLLLILCLHNAGHYWDKLSMINDIAQLINSTEEFNWSVTLEIAKKLAIKRILFINLLLANNLLNLKLPDEILFFINSDDNLKYLYYKIVKRIFLRGNKEFSLSEKIIMRIRLREKIINKVIDFINLIIVPTPSVLESVSLPYYLAPIYHLFRIKQLFKNYVINTLRSK